VADVHCEITATPAGGLLRIEGVARSPAAIAGQYTFAVVKNSASGSSQSMQGGRFSLRSSDRTVIAQVVLDRSAEGHFDAELSLEWEKGRASCHSP